MPQKKSNEIERSVDVDDSLGDHPSLEGVGNDIIDSVEPLKKKRNLTDEQRAKQIENLKKGREALQAKREQQIKERAHMLHDAVVDASPKPKKEDLKMKRILEAVKSVSDEVQETDEEIVVVKKRAPPKKRVIVVQEEEEDTPSPPPAPKKRAPRRKQPIVEDIQNEAPAPPVKPSILFY